MSMSDKQWYADARPYFVGAAITVAYVLAYRNRTLPSATRELFPAMLNISAITVGFLATAKSIMFSVGDTRRIRVLKQHGSYYALIDSLLRAIHWSLALSLASSVCILVVDAQWKYSWIFVGGWLFCAVVAGVWFYQVVGTLASILKSKDQ